MNELQKRYLLLEVERRYVSRVEGLIRQTKGFADMVVKAEDPNTFLRRFIGSPDPSTIETRYTFSIPLPDPADRTIEEFARLTKKVEEEGLKAVENFGFGWQTFPNEKGISEEEVLEIRRQLDFIRSSANKVNPGK